MPGRLLKPYNGQAANTMYFGSDLESLVATGVADLFIEQASDFVQQTRIITDASASIIRAALIYPMNSGSAQALTLNKSGYWDANTVLTFIQLGTGVTTITPATGVTINGASTPVATQGQFKTGQMIKYGPDAWAIVGGLA